jgi:primase-polymerase (primpol)-like protein
MGFVSQAGKSKLSSRRGSKSDVVVSQIYKPSTKSEEMSFRLSSGFMSKFGVGIGSRVDVLRDDESDLWMIKKSDDGFLISGKEGAPTGLIRYTLKEGHARLVDERSELPFKKEVGNESITVSEDSVIFGLLK